MRRNAVLCVLAILACGFAVYKVYALPLESWKQVLATVLLAILAVSCFFAAVSETIKGFRASRR